MISYILLGDKMDNIKLIKKRNRQKRKAFNYKNDNCYPLRSYYFLSKIMLLLVIFLSLSIYLKCKPEQKLFFYEKLFNTNFPFAKVNNLYQQYLGNVIPFIDFFTPSAPVFAENFVYKTTNIYKDGVALTVAPNYLVPSQEKGIIIFIGEKEDYGKTIIIQQENGIDLWYGNLANINVNLYDYVDKGTYLGEVKGEKLYLVYKREGTILDYKNYLN